MMPQDPLPDNPDALRLRRRRLRRLFGLLAYGAFGLWVIGMMLTIFAKGITLPGEVNYFGSPLSLTLMGLSVACAIAAWMVKRRLESVRTRGAPPPPEAT